jgi:hypothetical protein
MPAAANHKLTKVIAGRTIRGTNQSGGKARLSFDGSAKTLKTAPSNSNSVSKGGKVEKVRQSLDPPVLYLDLEGRQSLEVPLAEATSSVMLRSKAGDLEYAD